MPKIYTPLSYQERDALAELAEREKRDTRQQAALLIRNSLEQLGLLQPLIPTMEANQNEQK